MSQVAHLDPRYLFDCPANTFTSSTPMIRFNEAHHEAMRKINDTSIDTSACRIQPQMNERYK